MAGIFFGNIFLTNSPTRYLFSKIDFSRAAVPSGASTGIYEALELRDKADTWHGKGVQKVLATILPTIPSQSHRNPITIPSQSHCNLITILIMSPPQAVHNINNMIAPEIVAKCMDPVEQEKIDQLMVDSSSNVKM